MDDNSFLTIATNIRTGGVFAEFNNDNANQSPGAMPNRIVIFGQMLAGGTAAAGVPVLIAGQPGVAGLPGAWAPLFGAGSQLERMCTAAKNANPWTETLAVPLQDDAEGTAATGSIVVSGAATENGTQLLYIGGDSTMFGALIEVAITPAMTPAEIATAIVAQIAATPNLPVTAAIDGENAAKINFTAIHRGEFGNTVDLRTTYYSTDANVPGLAFAITAMTGGEGNPSLVAAIAAITNQWFNHWIVPYSDGTSLAAIQAELDRRWGGMVMQEGHAYFASAGSVGTLATFGATFNTQELTCMGIYKSPSPAYLWAAVLGAVIAYNSAINQTAALRTLLLPGIGAPALADRFEMADRNNLLYDGISTFYVDDDNQVRLERAITMYRTDPAGALDPSYLAVETLMQLFWMRWSWRTYMAQIYQNFGLADDGTPIRPGSRIATPSQLARSTLALVNRDWLGVVVQDIADFKKNMSVTRDIANPDRANFLLPPNLIAQLNTMAAQIAFVLGTATPAAPAANAGP